MAARRFLSLKQVLERYPISRSKFWQLRRDGLFPPPTIMEGRHPWWASDVLAKFEAQRIRESEGKKSTGPIIASVGGDAPVVDKRYRRTGGRVST
jgi:predicted DNA-binding transcriptional regulator AlpA